MTSKLDRLQEDLAAAKPVNGSAKPVEGAAPPARGPSWLRHFGFKNVGVVYVWIGIIIVFSLWAPDTFPNWDTVKSVLNQNAIAGLIALSLVVPLSARVFDLSVGSAMGLCNVIIAWLLVNKGVAIVPAIALTIAAGLVIGLVNALVVVGARIDSFIATLATGSLMAAAISLISKDQAIIGEQLGGGFGKIATSAVGGIALPVFLMLIVALGLWFVQGYTVVGRRIYATGFNEGGARLAGIRTDRLRFASLIVSGVVAGIAGVLLASQVSSGSPNIGPPYLLDAFAAVFLGATQFGGQVQRVGHSHRRAPARHRQDGTHARRRRALGAEHVQRRRPALRARPDEPRAHARGPDLDPARRKRRGRPKCAAAA